MAVNLFTMKNQPTALQLLTGNVPMLGDAAGSDAYLAATVSIIGIAVCLICVFTQKSKLMRVLLRVLAILTVVILAVIFFILSSDYGSGIVGFGYWGICVLLLVLCFAPRKKTSAKTAKS